MTRPREYPNGREDHFVPAAYLKGFADPARAGRARSLFRLDLDRRTWRECSARQIGWEHGFYDFVGVQGDRRHIEEEFTELENEYPRAIAEMRSTGFEGWRQHSSMILRYVNMLRCRSPLFRKMFMREWGAKRAARMIGIPGGNKVQVDSLRLRRFSPRALRDASLASAVQEMKKTDDLLGGFFWQLRTAHSVGDGFVTCEQPLISVLDEGVGLARARTVMLFPLCWEACLVGRRDPLAVDLREATAHERTFIRKVYFDSARCFVVSPSVYRW